MESCLGLRMIIPTATKNTNTDDNDTRNTSYKGSSQTQGGLSSSPFINLMDKGCCRADLLFRDPSPKCGLFVFQPLLKKYKHGIVREIRVAFWVDSMMTSYKNKNVPGFGVSGQLILCKENSPDTDMPLFGPRGHCSEEALV